MIGSEKFDIEEEKILIEKAKANSIEFRPLYEKYYKLIFLFVLHRVNDKSLAADVTSQTFFKALVHIKKYESRGLPFSAWLYRVAINEVNSFFRKKKNERFVSIDDDRLLQLQEELADDLTLEALKSSLRKMLEKLSESELCIIELRFFEGLSFREIGEIFSITEINAKVKTYRAIDKLRKFLKGRK